MDNNSRLSAATTISEPDLNSALTPLPLMLCDARAILLLYLQELPPLWYPKSGNQLCRRQHSPTPPLRDKRTFLSSPAFEVCHSCDL